MPHLVDGPCNVHHLLLLDLLLDIVNADEGPRAPHTSTRGMTENVNFPPVYTTIIALFGLALVKVLLVKQNF